MNGRRVSIFFIGVLLFAAINIHSQSLQFTYYKGYTRLGTTLFSQSKNPTAWEIFNGPFATPSKFYESGSRRNNAIEACYSPLKYQKLKIGLLLHQFQYRESYCIDNTLNNYFTYKINFTNYSWRLYYQALNQTAVKKYKVQPAVFLSYNANILLRKSIKSFQTIVTGSKIPSEFDYDGIDFGRKNTASHSLSIGFSLDYVHKISVSSNILLIYSADYNLTDGLIFDLYRHDSNGYSGSGNLYKVNNHFVGLGFQQLLRCD